MAHESSFLELIVPEAEDPRVHAECIRIARQVRHSGRKIVGLVPAGANVAIPPFAVQLGIALGELTDQTVALVDANLRWPFAGVEGEDLRTLGDTAFTGRWLKGALALLAPIRTKGAGTSLQQLERILEKGGARCAHVIVDLTGFDQLGELLGAIDLCDGVIIVGRSGRTTESDLLRLGRDLPVDRNLGVVLVGQERAT